MRFLGSLALHPTERQRTRGLGWRPGHSLVGSLRVGPRHRQPHRQQRHRPCHHRPRHRRPRHRRPRHCRSCHRRPRHRRPQPRPLKRRSWRTWAARFSRRSISACLAQRMAPLYVRHAEPCARSPNSPASRGSGASRTPVRPASGPSSHGSRTSLPGSTPPRSRPRRQQRCSRPFPSSSRLAASRRRSRRPRRLRHQPRAPAGLSAPLRRRPTAAPAAESVLCRRRSRRPRRP